MVEAEGRAEPGDGEMVHKMPLIGEMVHKMPLSKVAQLSDSDSVGLHFHLSRRPGDGLQIILTLFSQCFFPTLCYARLGAQY